MEEAVGDRDRWRLVESYFDTYGLAHHQLSTFNHFLHFDIERTINDEHSVVFKKSNGDIHSVKFFGAHFDRPTIVDDGKIVRKFFPHEARLRDMTYSCQVSVQAHETLTDCAGAVVKSVIHSRMPLASVPAMLRSDACNLSDVVDLELCGEDAADCGGYFIINGKERVLVGQMRNAYNIPVCFRKGDDLFCDMRSMSEETGHSVLVSVRLDKKTPLVQLPYVKDAVPVTIVFKILGFDFDDYRPFFDDERVASYLCAMRYESVEFDREASLRFVSQHLEPNLKIQSSLIESQMGDDEHSAVPLDDDTHNKVEQIVNVEMFPHLGIEASAIAKARVLCGMLKRLFLVASGHVAEDDRDNYSFKRVEFAGQLCSDLFRLLYKKFLKTVHTQMEKQNRFDPTTFSKNCGITNGLLFSFSTGNWGVQRNNYIRPGVSQIPHPKVSQTILTSALRRVVLPSGKEGKNTKIRQLHPSSIFFMCPSETPEGQSVGVVLNLAMFVKPSLHFSTVALFNIFDLFFGASAGSRIPVFASGCFWNCVDDEVRFLDDFKRFRFQKIIPRDVSAYFNEHCREIHVANDAGRLLRPVLNMSAAASWTPAMSFQDAEDADCIRFLDSAEIEMATIAMTRGDVKKYGASVFDYMEIEPSAMLGVMAGQIPFSDHTQSPRICYQASMAKQAIGFIPTNYFRTETVSYQAECVQRPLVTTKMARAAGCNTHPNGINAMVAVCCYTGYNQEDSVIMNRSALDRGLFAIALVKTLTVEEKRQGQFCEEIVCLVPHDKRKFDFNYGLLDARGIVKPKSWIVKGDVLVGKIVKKMVKNQEVVYDDSLVVRGGEEGQVDRVLVSRGKTGLLIKVLVTSRRVPEIGDKFCSGMAQKGTCGMILPETDMPFCSDGTVPDIIINAHCIPSRMTINQIMACILGKISTRVDVDDLDGTPFQNSADVFKTLCAKLEACGLAADGTDVMFNGMTGEKMGCSVFHGPTYYHRLKHLVSEKIHARAHGQVAMLTRQPNCGRSKNGGLRVGEMEKDSMLVHGVSKFVKERMFENSDYYVADVCRGCGSFAASNVWCETCGASVVRCNIPYATKLVIQELNAIGISTFISTS
jgi:DNA-directed RNA polymerase II subunit RPB2